MAPDLHNDPHLRTAPNIAGFKVLPPAVLYAKVGEGGMGCVYRGRHVNLDVDVAVKCLNPSLATDGRGFVVRFQREARLAASIHHQNLVQVFDASSSNGVHYLVMEFVQGETARQRIRRKGRLSPMESALITLGAARGLAEAHARGIVHRDIKPDNIMISHTGCVKVSDLGLAKLMDEGGEQLTRTLATMGTPQYMAPEQWRDASSVGPGADVWALGATMYFLPAGDTPSAGTTMEECCRKICQDPFPDIGTVRDDVPEEMKKVIADATARDPKDRYPTAAELARALEQVVGNQPGGIVDNADSSDEITSSMVSPPPPQTLAQIRLDLESKYDIPTGLGSVSDPNISQAPAAPVAEPTKFMTRKRWISVAATLLVLVLGWVIVERVKTIQARAPTTWGAEPWPNPGEIHWTNQNPIQLAGKLDNPHGVDHVVVNREGQLPVETDTDDSGRWKVSLPLPIGETATFVVRTDDIGSTMTLRAQYDIDLPEITIDAPLKDAYIAKPVVDVRAKIKDASLDGAPKIVHGTSVVAMQQAGAEWSGQITLPEGENDIVVQAGDKAGNSGKSSVHVVVDTLPPTVSIQPPVKQALQGGAEQSFTFSFNEQVQNVKLNTADHREWPLEISATKGTWSGGTTIPIPPYSKGFDFTIEAEDLAGNALPSQSTHHSFAVSILGMPPTPEFEPVGDDRTAYSGTPWAKRIKHTKTGIELVLVPAGEFTFGAKAPNVEAQELKAAESKTQVAGPFWIGVSEVTAGQFALGLGRPQPTEQEKNLPASNLQYSDIQRFCGLNRLRLPTETEWEYAACFDGWSPTTNDMGRFANVNFEGGKPLKLVPVGSLEPNKLGLYDVIGNASELTTADYDEKGGELSKAFTIRGGNYNTLLRIAGPKNRWIYRTYSPAGSIGFRVVLDAPPVEGAGADSASDKDR